MWVVWALGALFDSALADDLTFKGGTSLSKAYKVIDRFSEDIDLTYDIRKLIPDLIGGDGFLPSSRSQASKWTRTVRERLPEWIATKVRPIIEAALARDQLHARLEMGGDRRIEQAVMASIAVRAQGWQRGDNDLVNAPEVGSIRVQIRVIRGCPDVEHPLQSHLPLTDQLGRAKNQHPLYLSACKQGPKQQAGFDRLSHADVVSDQQTHRPRTQRTMANP